MTHERAWTAWIVACVFLVALASIWRIRPNGIPAPASVEAPGAPALQSPAVPLVSGSETIQEQFVRAGCPVCHTIPGIAGAQGRVGPPLLLGTTGPERLQSRGYTGRARTVREYIIESIVAPQEYVVPGYPGQTMPTWYGMKLSAAALDQMAAYLEKIRTMDGLGPSDVPGTQATP